MPTPLLHVRRRTTLTSLDLAENIIRDGGASALAETLCLNKTHFAGTPDFYQEEYKPPSLG
jgi:hypothetical protein